MLETHLTLILGAVSSGLNLLALAIRRAKISAILTLETRWLLLAEVPNFVRLIVGGYIFRLKGLSIELESRLRTPIRTAKLQAIDALQSASGQEKGSLKHLDDSPPEKRVEIKWWSFVSGRRNYLISNAKNHIIYEKDPDYQDAHCHEYIK